MSKFKQLPQNDKENIYNVALVGAFILCIAFLKPIVRVVLAYADFCEKILN